jgi:cyanate permease
MFLIVAMLGLGGPMISIGCPKTISVWFRGKERGTAVGFYLTGPWIGGLVAYSTVNSIVMPLTGYSWRLTFVVYGLVVIAIAFLWFMLARDVRSSGDGESTGIFKVFSNLISVRNVRLIIIMVFFGFAIGHGFNDWIPKILENRGFTPADAGFAASLPLLIGIPIRLLVAHIAVPRIRLPIIVVTALVLASALLLVASSSGGFLILGLLLFGVSFGPILPILTLVLMETPGVSSQYMGSATGMVFAFGEVGGFVGPFLIGALKDLMGSLFIGVYFIAGMSVALSVMGLFLKTKPAPATPGED